MSEEFLRLSVKASIGAAFIVEVRKEQTVADLKSQIQLRTQIPVNRQCLLFKGESMKHSDPLALYDLEDGCTINLVTANSALPLSRDANQATAASPGATRGLTSSTNAFMSQMMELPIFQSIFSNPEIMRTMLRMNPAMQEVMERNPELAEAMDNPQMLQQMMAAVRHPSLMNEMSTMSDRALSNLDTIPGGMNALTRMYNEVQKPLLEGLQQRAYGTSSTTVATECISHAGEVRRSPPKPRRGPPNTTPLPNPWTTPAIQRLPWGTPAQGGSMAFPSSAQSAVPNFDLLSTLQGAAISTPTTAVSPALQSYASSPHPHPEAPAYSSTISASADTRVTEVTQPPHNYEQEVKEIVEMGFPDVDTVLNALRASGGDVTLALEQLLGEQL